MENLKYIEKIAVIRILEDLEMTDRRVDPREEEYLWDIKTKLGLGEGVEDDIRKMSALFALSIIEGLPDKNKAEFSRMMGRMITVDKDINYNEVRVYNVVKEFCDMKDDFEMDDYPGLTKSPPYYWKEPDLEELDKDIDIE